MRYLKTTVLSIIGSLFFIGCNHSVEKNTIKAHQDGIQFIYNYDLKQIDTVFTKKDQAISFKFGDEMKNGVLFHPQTRTRIPVYLRNNKTNSIIVDSVTDRKVYFHYTGENASINHYIYKSFSTQNTLAEAIQKDYPTFESIINEAVSLRKVQLDSLSDNDFKNLEKITIDYLPKNLKLTYAFQRAIGGEQKLDSINSEITQLINERPTEDTSLLESDAYLSYLNLMSQINFFKTHPDKFNSIYDYIIYSKDYFQNKEIIGAVGENLVNLYLNYMKDTSNDSQVKQFINEYITDTHKKEELLNQFKDRNKFSKGQIAPSFSGTDIQGKIVNSESLKGKYLVIDVWATWCGPCKREAPFFEKLAEQYKDDDRIEFISISIDKDKNAWENFIHNEKPFWINLWVENDFQSTLAKDYEIQGIPYFMIIDPNGKFATSSASRPSDNMGEQIAQFLK